MSSKPAIELAIFSSDNSGEYVNGEFRRTVQDRLAWVLTWRNLECTPARGPANREPEPTTGVRCERLVGVDAMTLEPFGAWETDMS